MCVPGSTLLATFPITQGFPYILLVFCIYEPEAFKYERPHTEGCSGDEIEEMMQREEIITVIQFLRSVPGAELKGMPTEAGG